jgi:hypothetical protein
MTNTTNKGYNLQVTGSNVGTWGTVLNSILSTIDTNIGSTLALSVAGNSNVTLSSSQAGYLIHNLTGALTGNIQYIFPSGGFYQVKNNTSGSYTLTVNVTGGSGGVTIPQGSSAIVFVDTTVPQVVGQIAITRQPLTANAIYYVSTSGNDSNNGLNSSSPWATIQHAVNYIAQYIDLAGYNATIQLADGTYNQSTTVSQPFVGGTAVIIQGNTGTPSNVNITGSTPFNIQGDGTVLTINSLKITPSSGNSLIVTNSAQLYINNLVFGAAGSSVQIYCGYNANFIASSGYTIAGGAGWHLFAEDGGTINVNGQTVTLSGTPNFSSAFAYASVGGAIAAQSMTFSGSATGSRFSSINGGFIQTGSGGNLNYFPGNAAGNFTNGFYDGLFNGNNCLLGTNNLSDVASAATSATNLGLGTGNSPTFTNLTLSGGLSAVSAAFSSTISAATPAGSDNSTTCATTAFVQSLISTLPHTPTNSVGVGQWVTISNSVPSGGTWAYFTVNTNGSGSVVGVSAGVVNGGTSVGSGVPVGFAWRIS